VDGLPIYAFLNTSRDYTERKDEVLACDGGCVITGLAARAVIAEFAHIIPSTLSRHLNGFDSPFYKVEIVWPFEDADCGSCGHAWP
jgi:hypothetical protein